MRRHFSWMLILPLLAAGCASSLHIRNMEATTPASVWPDEQRFDPGPLVLGLAFSGGGTRAASFAYGVMKELATILVPLPGGATSNLLGEVDYISSVSGGSFTAAYYTLFRDEPGWAEQFEQKVLREHIEDGIFQRLLSPANLVPMAFTDYSRTDVAAEYYGEEIFQKRRMGDLPQRPWLILNATDMVTGIRFEFTNEFFACLGSDLSSYPVGHAVAASSAFPVAFKPVTLKNFGQKEGKCITLRDLGYLQANFTDFYRRNMALRKIKFLQEGGVQYVHLSDGGITDNLGLQGLLERFRDGRLANRIRTGQVKGTLFISVNSANASDVESGKKSEGPSIAGVIERSLDLMLENATARTSTVFADRVLESAKEGECAFFAGGRCLFIDVKFNDMKDTADRDRLNRIGTRLQLESGEIDALIDAGRSLLYCGNGQANWKALKRMVQVFEQEAGASGYSTKLEESAHAKCAGWPEAK
jgi:NTE family protein